MHTADIQKKRAPLKTKLANLVKQKKMIARSKRVKAKEKLKRNYKKKRDALAAILWKLHSRNFAKLDLSILEQQVAAILTPPKAEVTPAIKPKNKIAEVVNSETEVKVDAAAFTEPEATCTRPTLAY